MKLGIYNNINGFLAGGLLVSLFIFGPSGCRQPELVAEALPQPLLRIERTAGLDSSMERYILPYREQLQQRLQEVVAVLETEATKGRPESTLGNLVCDVLLREAAPFADTISIKAPLVVLMNHGGLRAPLPRGPVNVGHLYELMPFENRLTAVLISADSISGLIRYIITKNGEPVSGLRLVLGKNLEESGCWIQDRPCKQWPALWIITSDYLADGGDRMAFLRNPLRRYDLGLTVREALIQGLRKWGAEGPLKPSTDGRITIISTGP
ncbi:MAG: 5'-nucleotidase C-terminal domain-containing protein [Flavobacteriales bacterium]|nr:5'-nucleotidase C-terminal domain-containing protein [Flavobacteriales bacterium]MCX7768690.1 5'-nucleotidase C-terminal domain-containing protein [Flavobacteriales bacterium]MDW8410111.1 5'-nucleotidase C-terminal domain-containing protein [Flavobacteriales bacterium]